MFGISGVKTPHSVRSTQLPKFIDHTEQRTTVGRTPLDQRSVRHRDF